MQQSRRLVGGKKSIHQLYEAVCREIYQLRHCCICSVFAAPATHVDAPRTRRYREPLCQASRSRLIVPVPVCPSKYIRGKLSLNPATPTGQYGRFTEASALGGSGVACGAWMGKKRYLYNIEVEIHSEPSIPYFLSVFEPPTPCSLAHSPSPPGILTPTRWLGR